MNLTEWSRLQPGDVVDTRDAEVLAEGAGQPVEYVFARDGGRFSKAIQAFAGDVLPTRDGVVDDTGAHPPFQLDRCHSLRRDGPAVAKYYPRWVVKPVTQS